ncbi:MAG: hypothetical protein ABL962_21200, partial [Fimbriimonadaceae bacterium]
AAPWITLHRQRLHLKTRKNCPTTWDHLSRDIVSLYGTWVALKAKLPFADKDGLNKYVVEKFNQHIFSSQDFANAMKRSIGGGIKDIEGIENDLATALRQEILGRSLGPGEIQKAEVEFRDAIAHLLPEARKGAGTAAGGLLAEATTDIATQVLLRLGVSAGILAAGAASSWWTFGGTLIIGVAVSAIWHWVTKPAERIEVAMVTELEKMSRNGSDAIRNEMTKVVAERSSLWRKSVEEALL